MTRESIPETSLIEKPEAVTDAQLGGAAGGYFPFDYVAGLLRLLADHPAAFEAVSYADLPWQPDDVPERSYPGEHAAWKQNLKDGRRDPRKIYILLQYDVDSFPHRTMDLLRHPVHRGIPANVMIFNKRVDRRRLARSGEVAHTEYWLDDDLLNGLRGEGFVVGYHINALDRAGFDVDRATDIFGDDVRELAERFGAIRFISAHGGPAGPDGKTNRDLPYLAKWRDSLLWIHNGYTPVFDKNFSDGGHNSLSRDPAGRDLREFVRGLRPGQRARILLHPQYYSEQYTRSRRYSGTPWYDVMVDAVEGGHGSALWDEVRAPHAAIWDDAGTPLVDPSPGFLARWSKFLRR